MWQTSVPEHCMMGLAAHILLQLTTVNNWRDSRERPATFGNKISAALWVAA